MVVVKLSEFYVRKELHALANLRQKVVDLETAIQRISNILKLDEMTFRSVQRNGVRSNRSKSAGKNEPEEPNLSKVHVNPQEMEFLDLSVDRAPGSVDADHEEEETETE